MSWVIRKDPDAGKDWGQEEKGMTEDEMVGWHHWLNGRGFGWTPGVGDGQRGLACCSWWGRKESDMTEQLNWTEWSKILPSQTSSSTVSCNCVSSVSKTHYIFLWTFTINMRKRLNIYLKKTLTGFRMILWLASPFLIKKIFWGQKIS